MNMADNQSRGTIGELNVKVNVDIADALTGLKALQREAKETTKALRELECSKTKPSYDGYRSFKHIAKYLTVEMQNGLIFTVDLGYPTGEQRTVYINGHQGIKHMYTTDDI
jgi:hypothetical protein